jgi:hypothetical protein
MKSHRKLVGKKMAIVMTTLLLTVIIPAAHSAPLTRENNIDNPGALNFQEPIPKLTGTLGSNGWYTSTVTFSFIYDPEIVDEIWYFYEQTWKQYTSGVQVSREGYTRITWYWIETTSGDQFNGTSFSFAIDKTPPSIKLSKTAGSNKATFSAACDDVMSKVDYVEFYLDDEIQSTTTAEPHEWTWTGNTSHDVYAIVYDKAGLEKKSNTLNTPRSINLHFHSQLLHALIQEFLGRIFTYLR